MKRWEEYLEKQRYTCTPEYFIETYGEVQGLKKYNDFVEKRLIGSGGKGYSYIADEFFESVYNHFKGDRVYTHFLGTGEKLLGGKYHLDYYDETLNVGIEFYGDFWHANPERYREDEIILGQQVSDIWLRDEERIAYLNEQLKDDNGRIYVVWENDYKVDPAGTINKLVSDIFKNHV